MIAEFSLRDLIEVLLPKPVVIARMLLITSAVGVVAFLIAYTIIKGG